MSVEATLPCLSSCHCSFIVNIKRHDTCPFSSHCFLSVCEHRCHITTSFQPFTVNIQHHNISQSFHPSLSFHRLTASQHLASPLLTVFPRIEVTHYLSHQHHFFHGGMFTKIRISFAKATRHMRTPRHHHHDRHQHRHAPKLAATHFSWRASRGEWMLGAGHLGLYSYAACDVTSSPDQQGIWRELGPWLVL